MSDTNNKTTNQPSNHNNQDTQLNQEKPPVDESKVVDPMDLVYKGGYTKDPQEILGNPAVAPQMYTESRDLRVDIFREAEETVSNQSEETDDN
jgi:hypothetical protein